MEGMRQVKLCGNLRDTTSQNNPASLINHTGCSGEEICPKELKKDAIQGINSVPKES